MFISRLELSAWNLFRGCVVTGNRFETNVLTTQTAFTTPLANYSFLSDFTIAIFTVIPVA